MKTFALIMFAMLFTVGSTAQAAPAELECADGKKAVGYIGIGGLSCNCTVARIGDSGERTWQFRAEPTILRIDADSPAYRLLEEGDVIVSINGTLITTSKAGRFYGSPTPLEQMDFVVRRAGATVAVPLIPEPVCPDDPRVKQGPTAPRAPMPPHAPVPVHALEVSEVEPPRALTLRRVPEAPAPPPLPDIDVLPRGWLGMGISCDDCVVKLDGNYPGWQFTTPPEVYSVDAGSPAQRAGLQAGDVLTHINGIPLVQRDGAELFSEIYPGQDVTWTIERAGAVRVVHMKADAPPAPRAASSVVTPSVPSPPTPQTLSTQPRESRVPAQTESEAPAPPVSGEAHKLRFAGTLGSTTVDVWGISSIVVTMDEARGELIIQTGSATIRLRTR